jgi:lactoylglutathione lyase
MKVERAKEVIWAADMNRAMRFYRDVLGGEVFKESEIITEVVISGATIAIPRGGDGNRTRTGLSFQVSDVIAGGREVAAARWSVGGGGTATGRG